MIITKPSPYKTEIWRGTCQACKCEAEAARAEMTKIESSQREPGEWSWEKCPECGAGPYSGILFRPVKP